jgi:hypothetical protein
MYIERVALLGECADAAVDIQLVCKYKLDKQIAQQSRAFFNGLSDIIDPKCKPARGRTNAITT